MKVAEKAYWWWEDSHIDCEDWLILQELLRSRYAPHRDGPQFSDLISECKEILTSIVNMLEKEEVVKDPKPEPELDDKSGPEVVAELMSL